MEASENVPPLEADEPSKEPLNDDKTFSFGASPAKSDEPKKQPQTADREIKTEPHIEDDTENVEDSQSHDKLKNQQIGQDTRARPIETPARQLDGLRSPGQTSEHDLDEEQLYRYSQLSNKLNTALSRIQHCKYLSVKSPDRQSFKNTYKRFEEFEKKRKDAIQRKAKEIQDEKLKQLKLRPAINENSINMTKSHDPIYQRYDRELERRNKKLEQEREKKKRHEEEEYEKYVKNFEQKNQKPEKFRSAGQFYEQLVRWKQKNIQKAQEKKEQQKNKQVEGITFKPVINERSKKLLKKVQRQPIYEREPKAPRPIKQQFDFKPKINKKPIKP